MTPDDFRRLALGMADVVEGAHMDHPDFRVHGKIFATIHPDHAWGMVKLTPEQQQRFVRDAPHVFKPENGAWGLRGYTAVRLSAAEDAMVGEAMTLAWQNIRGGGRSGGRRPGKRAPRRPSARRG